MKKLILFALVILVQTKLSKSEIIKVVANNGKWAANATWDLKRQPKNNDTILVPAGMRVILDKQKILKNVHILVLGTLELNKGKLKLDDASVVNVDMGGKITGSTNNDWIKINNVSKFTGTQLSVEGPAWADYTTGSAPYGFINYATLPVKFESFLASRNGTAIELKWSTSQESENIHYEIEKSTDGRSWKMIALVFGDNNSSFGQYTYSDHGSAKGTLYYRIRQVDGNGRSLYSSVRIILDNRTDKTARIFKSGPQNIMVDLNREVKGNVVVRIFNLNGQVLARHQEPNAGYRVNIQTNNNLSGLVVVQVSDASGWNMVQKLVL